MTSVHEESTSFPLTAAQLGVFLDMARHPVMSAAYNIGGYGDITGVVDVECLKSALRLIVQRHPALRTRIDQQSGSQPMQVIYPHLAIEPADLDFSHAPNAEQNAIEWMTQDMRQPIDLHTAPLFRFALLKIAEQRYFRYAKWHHMIVDGISIGLLLKEIAEAYSALASGSGLQILPCNSYFKYMDDQTHVQGSAEYFEARRYWNNLYSTPPPRVSLSVRPSKRALAPNAVSTEFTICPSRADALRARAANSGVNFSELLIASVGILLGRLTGATDFSLGLPVHGRRPDQLATLVGMCINTLPLRLSVPHDATVDQVLRQVAEHTRGALCHQAFRYEDFREGIGRYYRGLDPFAVSVNIIRWRTEVEYLGVQSASHVLSTGPIHDLSVTLTDRVEANALKVQCRANSQVFELWELESISDAYDQLLEAIVSESVTPVSELRILSAPVRKRILTEWNCTAFPFDERACMHELFERRARANPDRVAVNFEGRVLTYAQLNAKANQLARHLASLGVRRGSRVALDLERSEALIQGVLAILKVGGTYVPLDPAQPQLRTRFILEQCGISVVITERRWINQLGSTEGLQCCVLDEISTEQFDGADLNCPMTSEEVAYILFTSGSTGRPKGVEVEHRSVVNLLMSIDRQIDFCEDDIVASVTTLTFDIAVLEIFAPLMKGGTICLVARSTAYDGQRLRELLRGSRATIMQATPTTWQMLVNVGWEPPHEFKILCGGEALTPALAGKLLVNSARVWNLYGPTETTIWSTFHELKSAAHPIPIGRPLSNTKVYVLDGGLQPLPIGVVGELWIGGVGVARGYCNNLDLTNSKFIPNPFESTGDRMYRTGDLARFLTNGDLEFHGRVDSQVKIRGFRVELGEVEAVLHEHSEVRQSAVILRDDGNGPYLAAYVIWRSEPIDGPTIRAFLREKLPDYMIPATFMAIHTFPRLHNGKLDYKSLPSPVLLASPNAHLAARTDVERHLVAVFAEILQHQSIGIQDDFFELGGDSLRAMQAAISINEILHTSLDVEDIFEATTVALLAARIETIAQSAS